MCSSCVHFLASSRAGPAPAAGLGRLSWGCCFGRGFQSKQVAVESQAAVQLWVLYLPSHSCTKCPWMFFQDEVGITGELLRIHHILCCLSVSQIPRPNFYF